MCIVKPIVTGDLERLSIHKSLGNIFPECKFLVPTKTDSITSNSLPDPKTSDYRENCQELAKTAITAMEDKSGDRPDMVLIVEDLELCNLDQPQIVIQWVCRSIREVLETEYSSQHHRERAAQRIRETVSFHLLSPMVEAYFFADRNSLTLAQVPDPCDLHLVSDDLEAFETNHPGYLQSEPRRAVDQPGRHPKNFIRYLSGGSYRESKHGTGALINLNWNNLNRGAFGSQLIRSMFEDVADVAGVQNPIGGPISELTYPTRSTNRNLLTLRNV